MANLPAGFHSNVNQTDARDIRVTKSDAVTELPREVVFYDAANDAGELHFKYTGTLSGTTDTDVYIYYGNTGASDYARDAIYGLENVWNSNYITVYHLQEAVNNDANGYKDSTNNNKHGTGVSMAITAPTGKLSGRGAEFDGATDRIGSISQLLTNNTWSGTAWVNIDAMSGNNGNPIFYQGSGSSDLGSEFGLVDEYPSAGVQALFGRSGGSSLAVGSDVNYGLSAWHHYGGTFSNTAATFYYDGGAGGSGTVSGGTHSANPGAIAAWYNYADANRYLDGKIDELRIRDDVVASTWISTEYNNQNSPSTFYNVGSEEEVPELVILLIPIALLIPMVIKYLRRKRYAKVRIIS